MFARPIRIIMTCAYRASLLLHAITGRRPLGVHGVVLTPRDEVVLVRLTYSPGWQLPGGGRKRGESAKDGLLRELREEIGLRAWATIEELQDRRRPSSGQAERGATFVVRGAVYQPHWSLEIAEVRAFTRATLPADTTPWTRAALVGAAI